MTKTLDEIKKELRLEIERSLGEGPVIISIEDIVAILDAPERQLEPVSGPEIVELMAAAERATPRPWEYDIFLEEVAPACKREGVSNISVASVDAYWQNDKDGKYIALAANLAPKLVARIQELEGALAPFASFGRVLPKEAKDITDLEALIKVPTKVKYYVAAREVLKR